MPLSSEGSAWRVTLGTAADDRVDGIIAMLVGTATGIAVVAAGVLTVGVVAVDVVVVGVGVVGVVVGVVVVGVVVGVGAVVGGVVGAGGVVVGGGAGTVGVGVVGAGAVVVGGGVGVTATEGSRLNVTLTVTAAFPVTVQAAVPEQAPLQPSNLEPEAAVALRVTSAPGAYVAVQLLPQLIPTGVLLTVPVPVPTLVMVML